MVGATGAGVAASSAGVGCRRCRGVEQAPQAGPPPTQLAGWRTFLMRFTSAEPMRRLTPAITAKGTRYTVEAGPQARVQGCSGGQGRDVGGRVRSRVEARVGGQGRGGGGAGLWLVVGAPRTSPRVAAAQLLVGQQNNWPTCLAVNQNRNQAPSSQRWGLNGQTSQLGLLPRARRQHTA